MKNALKYTLVFVAIQVVASILVNLALELSGHSELRQSPYAMIALDLLFSLVTLVVFLRTRWAEASADYLRSRPWTVIVWSVVAASGALVPSIAVQEMMPELPNFVEEEMGGMMNARGGYFVICLLAPLVEELVMRGAVLRALLLWRKDRPWTMIAISAFLFALIHMNPAQMPHAFVIGLLLGWMFYRTGSIVPGVAYHWANNTAAFILFKLYPDPSTHLIDILGTQRNVAAAVAFSLLILLPAIYQLNIWMKKE